MNNKKLQARREKRRLTRLKKRKIATRSYRSSFESFELNPEWIAILLAFIATRGLAAILLWSNLRGLSKAAKLVGDLLIAHRAAAPPGRIYYWITLTDDEGTTSDRRTIIDLDAVKDKTSRALRKAGLSAFVVTHIHPLMNFPGGGEGRSFLIGNHAIVWSDGDFDPAVFEKEITGSRAWTNSLGGKVIDIQQVGDTDEDFRRLSDYMFNPPYSAKNLMDSKRKPGKKLLMDTMKGYRPEFLLRTIEVMSQIALTDTFFSVNDRKGGIASTLRTQLETWHAGRVKKAEFCLLPEFDVWRFWLQFRCDHGSKNFEPVRIVSGGLVPKPPRPPKPKKSKPATQPRRKKRDVHWRKKLDTRVKNTLKRNGRKIRRTPRGRRRRLN